MKHNLLLVGEDISSVNNINNILRSEFPDIIIHTSILKNNIQELIEANSPDIILFDIEFTNYKNEQILENLSNFNTPFIVISPNDDYNKIFKTGAVGFIQKPFTKINLISNFNAIIKFIDLQESVRIKEREIEEKDQRIRFQIENELKQREIIIRKNKEIMADIRYASRIQQAILPNLDFIKENTYDYFILHQPKSHVSGDFYWLSCLGDKKVIAVGDCTGHGLSGALMHMLGSVYLNEIVSKGDFETASDILDQLRDHIMHSLNQTGESGEAQDGLDIALCIIDCETKKMQYAGANNPIYIIRNKELIEIRGDRMPVGIHINFNKPFTNHLIDIKSNDQLYLFSDGYADQFGGPKGKKFRYKQFKELILSISDKPMDIQKEIINNTHDKWRGSAEQIDDILVFGLKIK